MDVVNATAESASGVSMMSWRHGLDPLQVARHQTEQLPSCRCSGLWLESGQSLWLQLHIARRIQEVLFMGWIASIRNDMVVGGAETLTTAALGVHVNQAATSATFQQRTATVSSSSIDSNKNQYGIAST